MTEPTIIYPSQMRKFYTLWPMPPIFQTPSEKSAAPGSGRKSQTLSEKSSAARQNFPALEPRILLEDPATSYHTKHRVTEKDLFDKGLIFGGNLPQSFACEWEIA